MLLYFHFWGWKGKYWNVFILLFHSFDPKRRRIFEGYFSCRISPEILLMLMKLTPSDHGVNSPRQLRFSEMDTVDIITGTLDLSVETKTGYVRSTKFKTAKSKYPP